MRMRQTIFPILLAMVMAALTGCASAPVASKTDPAINRLNQAASSIQADLERLSKIKQAEFEKVELYKPPERGPLTKKITLKWAGPIGKVLEIIALTVDYDYKVRGKAPASPVLVNVDEVQTPAFEVLEDLGWRAGKHQVSVDAEKEIVQLTYFEHSYSDCLNARLRSED